MPQQVTIRKATKLRSKAEELLRTLHSKVSQDYTLPINVFDPKTVEQVDAQLVEFTKGYERYTNVLSAVYSLRKVVCDANENNKVNARLTFIAALDKKIGLLRGLVAAPVRLTKEQMEARVEGQKKVIESGQNYRASELSFSVLTQETLTALENELHGLKQQRDALHDELELVNANSKVELADEVLKILTDEKLI